MEEIMRIDNAEVEVGDYYCSAKIRANGKEACELDFGHSFDAGHCNECGCCENHVFKAKSPDSEVCSELGISEETFREIASLLEDKLSWGCCSLCS